MKRKRKKFQHVKDLQKSKTQTFNLEVGLASKAWGGLLLSSLNNLMLQSCVWFGLVCQPAMQSTECYVSPGLNILDHRHDLDFQQVSFSLWLLPCVDIK